MNARWYLRRLRRMSVREVAARFATAARQAWWSNPARRRDLLATLRPGPHEPGVALHRADAPTGPAADRVVQAAERMLCGERPVFYLRAPAAAGPPDWFRDPLTGLRAPDAAYCFHIPYRDEAKVGTIKFVWEPSRHQDITLLACAWWLTGDERFAALASEQLRSWWRDNPFLQGVHWVSGIEIGLRLLSWTWIRALLADWAGAPALFEGNAAFLRQLHGHSLFLSTFHSTGSSANNHRIAELAGLAAASTAFPWFGESGSWASTAHAGLAREAEAQTHEDGWNREQASGYHLFVAEMLLAAALPARMAGQACPQLEFTLRRMCDALAASLDSAGRPPRFGDSDDGRGLLLDARGTDAVTALLDAGRALFGAAPWWPEPGGSVLGRVAASLAGPEPACRAVARPSLFPGAGIAILRAGETWLRCDCGPHGYRSIAAHGHADALSVELRCGGVDVLADPGTYCYHGEAAWRAYFRGTAGHSTLVIGEADQAIPGGPFLWLTQPRTRLKAWQPGALWQASHDGYAGATHHRRVTLEGDAVTIRDWIAAAAPHPVLLGFHLGPRVHARLDGRTACLDFPGGSAVITLPGPLAWSAHRGEVDPPRGWYSSGFGQREPATLLAGRGMLPPGTALETCITLRKAPPHAAMPGPDRGREPAGAVRPPGVAGGDDAGAARRGRHGGLPQGEGVHTLA